MPDMLFHLYWNAFKNEDSAFLREAAAETMFGRGASPKDGEWGWIDVTDIRLADGSDLMPAFQYVTPDGPEHPGDQTVARVLFPAPVQPGESVRLRLEFRSKVPRTVARSGYYKESFFIAQWFPKPGVYEAGRGWNCHAYHQNSEFFADFADFVVHITAPSRFVARLLREADRGSAWTRRPDGRPRTFRQAMVHDFAWMADPRYLKNRAGFRRRPGGDPGGVRRDGRAARPARRGGPAARRQDDPAHRSRAQGPRSTGTSEALRAAIKYYGLWYGPYPYETVTMVDPPFRTGSGGMEYPTLFTAGNTGPAQPGRPVAGGGHRPRVRPRLLVRPRGQQRVRGGLARRGLQHLLDRPRHRPGLRPRRHVLRLQGLALDRFLRMPKNFDFELNRAAAINTVRYDPVTAWSWKFYNGGATAPTSTCAPRPSSRRSNGSSASRPGRGSCGPTTCATASSTRPRRISSASSTRSRHGT
ncbi:MAG: hypothetical protein MZV65_54015 [Chromatiales bacterium]|nr:hypothetical protein [Chromatiales bacterium]